MNIAIVDDLQSDRDKLDGYIRRYHEKSLIKIHITHYMSGEHFFEYNNLINFDIIFLDIFLNGMTGVEVARKIRLLNKKCLIVFISVSKDFIYESYDIKALYYLIKPYEYDIFQNVMHLINENLYHSSVYIEFKVNREQVMINVKDIVYVDLDKHYLQFHLKDELIRTYILTFNDAEKMLLRYPNFISCYRCIIINLNYVSKIDGKDFILKNSVRIPINRKRFTEIKNNYTRYIFDNILYKMTSDIQA